MLTDVISKEMLLLNIRTLVPNLINQCPLFTLYFYPPLVLAYLITVAVIFFFLLPVLVSVLYLVQDMDPI
jgi:hypothetical protein